jgi:hypothetical protein
MDAKCPEIDWTVPKLETCRSLSQIHKPEVLPQSIIITALFFLKFKSDDFCQDFKLDNALLIWLLTNQWINLVWFRDVL